MHRYREQTVGFQREGSVGDKMGEENPIQTYSYKSWEVMCTWKIYIVKNIVLTLYGDRWQLDFLW